MFKNFCLSFGIKCLENLTQSSCIECKMEDPEMNKKKKKAQKDSVELDFFEHRKTCVFCYMRTSKQYYMYDISLTAVDAVDTMKHLCCVNNRLKFNKHEVLCQKVLILISTF